LPAAWELVVMNAEGAHTSSVIATRPKSEGSFSSVSWSPAGEELALVSQGGPNGGQVLQLMKPDGTAVRTLTVSGTPPPYLLDIAWTAGPDALLALAVEQTGRDPHHQLLLIRTSDGHLEPVTNDASIYGDLSFSPGSGAIATIQTTLLGSTWIGPAARPEEAKELPGRLTDNDGLSGLTWVNNRQLVFTRRSGTSSLWMMNDDGTGARRLASLDSILRPTASRDGSLILFDGFRVAEGTQAVYRLDLPDGRATEVTLGKSLGAPTLSPDGRRVFFSQGRETPPARVLSMPLDGGPATTVFEAPMVFDHAVSRDGAQIAVIANTGVGTPRTISLLPAGGGPARTIFTTTSSVDHVRWYPSGDALVLRMIEKGQSNIYRLEVTGGAARQLTHFTRGEAHYPDISPDGRRIAYFRDTREFDIVLLKPKIE
jgi:Tol biopolymer transport system component